MKFLQKVEDFFRGQKDKKEILNTQRFAFSTTYMWDGEKIIKVTSKLPFESFTDNKNIDWVKSNPGKFYIKEITDIDRMSIEISSMERLDILGVDFEYDDWKNIFATVWFREEDFQEEDGMPQDILDYLISEVKNGLKKKANYYLKNYNILSSRSTTQKMKYRTSPLYSTRYKMQWSHDLKKGIFHLGIAVNFN